MSHTAIILIALGGPRTLDEIGPFMSAFIGRPAPLPVVAAVTDRYKQIGGRSPLPELVRAQAKALELELGNGFRVYEGFRYSNPAIAAAVDQAVRDGADRVVGLSLSPYATQVTTGAYKNAFELPASANVRKTFIASWHDNPLFVKAWEEKVFDGLKRFRTGEQKHAVVVFTSHSIPKRYIDAGDPYQRQVEETVRMIVQNLGIAHWRLAWQSKGVRATEPWLEPEVEPTLDELSRAGYRAVLEVPVGFTCDHLETLYDIDIVHRAHAKKLGITFERAASLNASTLFIKALADVARKAS
jgi:ferrochelatase